MQIAFTVKLAMTSYSAMLEPIHFTAAMEKTFSTVVKTTICFKAK